MEIHGYTATGMIDATIDGVRMTVPDDRGNRHRQMIAEWEAQGSTIPAYVPPAPSTDPASFPLSNRQLRLGLIRNGIGLSAVAAVIAAIPDAVARDEATVWWEYTEVIQWGHPMTQTLIALMGIPLANASAMWMAAKDYAA